MPQMMLISVVFPAPFGPSSAKISPGTISRSIPSSARNPDAYTFVSPCTADRRHAHALPPPLRPPHHLTRHPTPLL